MAGGADLRPRAREVVSHVALDARELLKAVRIERGMREVEIGPSRRRVAPSAVERTDVRRRVAVGARLCRRVEYQRGMTQLARTRAVLRTQHDRKWMRYRLCRDECVGGVALAALRLVAVMNAVTVHAVRAGGRVEGISVARRTGERGVESYQREEGGVVCGTVGCMAWRACREAAVLRPVAAQAGRSALG